MAEKKDRNISVARGILASVGALGGAAAWLLVEVLPDLIDNERLMLFLAAAIGGFLAVFLAAAGPLPPRRAGLAALIASVPSAALVTWASLRFEDLSDFLDTGQPMVAWLLIVGLSTPFLMAAFRPGEGWRNYPALFLHAWNVFVRYVSAVIFVGVVWGVVFLSNAMLGLVGLDIIERLIDLEPVPYILTGAVLGLGMAVVTELSDYVSPYLILRLFRLLLPPVLVVTVIFLVALPIQGMGQGLGRLFGGLSTAGLLMAIGFGIVTLITAALDCDDDAIARGPIERLSAQALALALPVIAGLAGYAIYLRVVEHGWTPDRLFAATAAAILSIYAVLYALAVLLRRNWAERIRQANILTALAAVMLCALWLTPLLDPQRISANDQLRRFAEGKISAEDLDLWFIGHELGRAGEDALRRLAAMDHPEKAVLQARLERLAAAGGNRRSFERQESQPDRNALVAELRGMLPVWPEGAKLPPKALDGLLPDVLKRIIEGCRTPTPAGNPGCVVVVGDFVPSVEGAEGMLISSAGAGARAVRIETLLPGGGRVGELTYLRGRLRLTTEDIDAILGGAATLGPVTVPALSLGDKVVSIRQP